MYEKQSITHSRELLSKLMVGLALITVHMSLPLQSLRPDEGRLGGLNDSKRAGGT